MLCSRRKCPVLPRRRGRPLTEIEACSGLLVSCVCSARRPVLRGGDGSYRDLDSAFFLYEVISKSTTQSATSNMQSIEAGWGRPLWIGIVHYHVNGIHTPRRRLGLKVVWDLVRATESPHLDLPVSMHDEPRHC